MNKNLESAFIILCLSIIFSLPISTGISWYIDYQNKINSEPPSMLLSEDMVKNKIKCAIFVDEEYFSKTKFMSDAVGCDLFLIATGVNGYIGEITDVNEKNIHAKYGVKK